MTKHALQDEKAPPISLPNFDGETFTFTPGDEGRYAVVFFYPKSGSYGCTKEVCQFRDALTNDSHFQSARVQVIGISPDSVASQKKFVEQQQVTYPILSDEKGEARKTYHVSKGLMGLTASSRVTFVIDPQGIVRKVYDSTMNYSQHVKVVTSYLASMTADSTKTVPASATATATGTAAAPEAGAAATAPPAATEHAHPAEVETEPPVAAPAPGLDPAAMAPAVPLPTSETAQ